MRSRSEQIRGRITTRPTSDEGATMVEYGLVVGFIALIAVPALVTLGPFIAELFQSGVDLWP